ncbi:hypothetical protein [Roseimaritima ulvae]|uniref:N-acetyltransferase domain-containing protein n=1 Tax=Roseimaritima ulvae TaxID=980254 RepID=A0A5B9QW82_9BACT|nr:hypothetical protein [Roseimaritima ulvae]QEG42040.1 hypothetical protein UC8_40700 [Roseimaritima ulvae]
MSTTVLPVKTSGDVRRFLELPWQLYRDDPLWVPPFRRNQRELAGFARHPFYKTATSQAFLATDSSGRAVGRILAIDNPVHNQQHGDNLGFFGFFEATQQEGVATSLFAEASDWLRQRGRDGIRGPVSPSMNYECGLLVDGFDQPPTFLMPYNPRYYGEMFEAAGFAKVQDLFTYTGLVREMKSDNHDRLAFIADKVLKRTGVQIRPLAPFRIRQEMKIFRDIYNRSFSEMWGFVPLSEPEVDHFASDLRFLVVPNFASFAEVEGEAVGIQLGLLDFSPIIKAIDGRLFPWGFLKLLFGKRKLKRLRLISTFVVPDFQASKGIGPALITRMIPGFESWGIEELEFSWVAESNLPSRAALVRSNTAITKTHRIYEKPL